MEMVPGVLIAVAGWRGWGCWVVLGNHIMFCRIFTTGRMVDYSGLHHCEHSGMQNLLYLEFREPLTYFLFFIKESFRSAGIYINSFYNRNIEKC